MTALLLAWLTFDVFSSRKKSKEIESVVHVAGDSGNDSFEK